MVLVGTSGWQYRDWRGLLYPPDLPQRDWLAGLPLCIEVARSVLARAGRHDSDIDWLVPHQANIRIMQGTAKKLKLPLEKLIVTVDEHGNTSAASIPLAFDHGVRSGRIKRGDTVMLEGVGGGFTWGAVLLDF